MPRLGKGSADIFVKNKLLKHPPSPPQGTSKDSIMNYFSKGMTDIQILSFGEWTYGL